METMKKALMACGLICLSGAVILENGMIAVAATAFAAASLIIEIRQWRKERKR